MDPINDRLVSEVPIDAVSNLVNKSITQYKDGKDAALIGGQKDNDDINTKTNDFYERMKEVVQRNPVTGNTEIERVGSFLFDTDNNMLKISSEAFGININSSEQLVKTICDFILKTQAIPACQAIQKYNDSFLMWFKESYISQIPRFKNVSLQDNLNNEFVKNILNLNIGEAKVFTRLSFDSNRDLLRNTTNLFSYLEKDKEFFNRYKRRYLVYKKYVDYICTHGYWFISKLVDLFESSYYNIDETKITSLLKEFMKTNREQLGKLFVENRASAIDDEDVYPFRYATYEFNSTSFIFEDKYKPLDNVSYEPTYKNFVSERDRMHDNFSFTMNGVNTFETMKLHGNIHDIEEFFKTNSIHSLGDNTLKNEASELSVLSVCDDMTCGEFVRYLENFNENTENFTKNIFSTIKECANQVSQAANKAEQFYKKSMSILQKLKTVDNPTELKLIKLCISVSTSIFMDTLQVISGMHSVYGNELLMKVYLFELSSRYYKYIYDGISKEGQGENK